uniref:Uncharacterized protein n=1 Tax=Schizaphis graminum TaxID=13262 RepID=A0A2S2P1C9_SCHGA
MISKCFIPNDTDGSWFECKNMAGPFENEMRCRVVSKALSDESQTCYSSEEPISDDDSIEESTKIVRHKKKPKCFSPETFKPKKGQIKLLLNILYHQVVQKYQVHLIHHYPVITIQRK